MKQSNMAVFKPENVEDFYEIGEVLGRYGYIELFKKYFTDLFPMYSNILDLKCHNLIHIPNKQIADLFAWLYI